MAMFVYGSVSEVGWLRKIEGRTYGHVLDLLPFFDQHQRGERTSKTTARGLTAVTEGFGNTELI